MFLSSMRFGNRCPTIPPPLGFRPRWKATTYVFMITIVCIVTIVINEIGCVRISMHVQPLTDPGLFVDEGWSQGLVYVPSEIKKLKFKNNYFLNLFHKNKIFNRCHLASGEYASPAPHLQHPSKSMPRRWLCFSFIILV